MKKRKLASGVLTNRCVRALLFGSLAVMTVGFWWAVDIGSFDVPAPFEDAAMLFRYADNLASGFGITWNKNQNPGLTDGATDLGFVLVLAPLINLGLSAASAALVTNLIAVFLLGSILYVTLHVQLRVTTAVTAIVVVTVMSGSINNLIAAGFSPPVMGLLLSMQLFFVMAAFQTSSISIRRTYLLLAGTFWGLCGLWRPEGFALGAVVALAVVLVFWRGMNTGIVRLDARHVWLLLLPPVILFAIWMAFRLAYFGQLLPTSAVMKGGSDLHLMNPVRVSIFLIEAILPILAALVVLSAMTKKLVQPWYPLMVIGSFSLIWLPVAMTLNHWNRMEWPLVPPLAALLAAWAMKNSREALQPKPANLKNRNVIVLAMGIPVALAVHGFDREVYFAAPFQSAFAAAVADTDTNDVRVATSEAGLIPLAIDGWALDTYGYNNRSIASTGGKSLETELRTFAPNLLVIHGTPPEELVGTKCDSQAFSIPWSRMVDTSYRFARESGMEILRSVETGTCDAWTIWIGRDLSTEMRQALAASDLPGRELKVQ